MLFQRYLKDILVTKVSQKKKQIIYNHIPAAIALYQY